MKRVLSRGVASLLVAACLAGPPNRAQPADAAPVSAFASEVYERTKDALWAGDFDELVRLEAQAVRETGLTRNGQTAVTQFVSGVGQIFSVGTPDASEAYFTNLDALTASWLLAHPDSSLALGLNMRALYAHAWWYRGGDYAEKLTAVQASLFDKTIGAELAVLKSHPHASIDTPLAIYIVMAGRSAGWPFEAQHQVADLALKARPQDDGLWRELVTSALPKWGGDMRLVDKVIREAASRQADADAGDIMYAWLWQGLSFEMQAEFFRSPVDWPRVKHGLELATARYPGDWSLNDMARLACLKGDRETAASALQRIGDKPLLARWGNAWDSHNALDRCRTWLRTPP